MHGEFTGGVGSMAWLGFGGQVWGRGPDTDLDGIQKCMAILWGQLGSLAWLGLASSDHVVNIVQEPIM